MKQYNKIFVIWMTAAMLLCSCDSFLDEQPRGIAIAEKTEHYNGMFNTNDFMNFQHEDYAYWLNDFILLPEECQEGLFSGTSMYDNAESIIEAFKYETEIYRPTENCLAWETCYGDIYTYNVIVNGVMDSEGGTEAQKKALQAEARMSRAWMHFILAQKFSKPYDPSYADTELTIPIVTEANSMEKTFERATMKDFYNFISTEMEAACPDLEDRIGYNMRIYKTTGYALLGKYYWMIGEYEKALEPLRIAYERLKNEPDFYLRDLNKIQEKYGYEEVPAMDLFMTENGSDPDCMIPYSWANTEIMFLKQNTSFMGPLYFGLIGMVTYYLKPECYDMFDEHDLRRNLIPTMGPYGTPTPYPVGCMNGNMCNHGVEIAEVCLALAECEARVGSQDNAKDVLVNFRKYRVRTGYEGIPETVQSQDDLIKFCLREQDREFMGRHHRFYNLRRLWNDPLFQEQKPITHSDGTNTYTMTEDNLYLKIPETVLKWNENWR